MTVAHELSEVPAIGAPEARSGAAVAAQGRAPAYPGAYARDPEGVYIENEEVGRDPDPNVRLQLRKDSESIEGF